MERTARVGPRPVEGVGSGERPVGIEACDRPQGRVTVRRRERRLEGGARSGVPARDGLGQGRGVQGRSSRQEGSLASMGTSKVPALISASRACIASTASAGTSSGTKMSSLPPYFMKEYSV